MRRNLARFPVRAMLRSVPVASDDMERAHHRKSDKGKRQEVFQLNGHTMPAFSFEKISPPVRRAPVIPQPKPSAKARRGAILRMIDRFVETRIKRASREDEGGAPQR